MLKSTFQSGHRCKKLVLSPTIDQPEQNCIIIPGRVLVLSKPTTENSYGVFFVVVVVFK